jgi:DNA repair photolyase
MFRQRLPKGRGATGNPDNRYDSFQRESFDDGWGGADEDLPPLRTRVEVDTSRTVISHNRSPDLPFDQSVNPYRGCEHGCIYCYARPSHAWLGLSPGLDFESRLFAKPEAVELLRRELSRPSYRCRPLALGTNTDPYQPIEREWRITRGVLELMRDSHHPVTIVTKSALIERDLDVLAELAHRGLVRVMISVTTLERELARRMEPRAAAPQRRLQAMRVLADAGVPVGVLVAPVIPALNDTELEAVLQASAAAGADSAAWEFLRLPQEVGELFRDWLAAHYPLKAEHVLNLLREARGGRLNDARFGARLRGEGEVAGLIARRFTRQCRQLGLDRPQAELDCSGFRVPAPDRGQLALF